MQIIGLCKMIRKIFKTYIPIVMFLFPSLACSVSQSVISPNVSGETKVVQATLPVEGNSVDQPSATDEIIPTVEPTVEDFSNLWVEYRDPKFGYGVAFPIHWSVQPTIIDGVDGTMTAVSYDEEFFRQNSIRGNWIDGDPPQGAFKMEFSAFEGISYDEPTVDAINQVLNDIEGMTVDDVEETKIGVNTAFKILHTDLNSPEGETWESYAFRIQPEVILWVHSYPFESIKSMDAQSILGSIVFSGEQAVILPKTAPTPPFELTNEVGVYPSAVQVTAWRGHIASLDGDSQFDDKVVLFPEGAGEVGIKGWTPEIEAEIVSLRDDTGVGEWVYFWGNLYCNYTDYNKCRLSVERLEYGEKISPEVIGIDDWIGTIHSYAGEGDTDFVFELSEPFPIWYGISSGGDETIQSQISSLSDSNTLVKVRGGLEIGVANEIGTRIIVDQLDPTAPQALPSSSACESGYFGSAAEVSEVIKYNLEIGNYYPFSYLIGNPFVIGYWQSEGISLPRGEAYDMLVNELLPSPEEVVVIEDPDQFPDLFGTPLSSMWGPEVDVAGNLYIKGWGIDGNGEAIAVIARCTAGDISAYFWYGILYAMNGF